SAVDRGEPLLDYSVDCSSPRGGGSRKARLAEAAGVATVECAAVCCCCPCVVADFLVLAVYRLPAGLCRKAIRRNRRLKKAKKVGGASRWGSDDEEFEFEFRIRSLSDHHQAIVNAVESLSHDEEVIKLENEMWEKFNAAGFWRAPDE
ncbi:hypothetical protein M569_04817, partial [Genlisea aurea]